jgi:type I restriction enzyme M protein
LGEENKKILEQQLWNIANTLRGKMDADEFRDYILGFIFYKYLSEKMEDYADDILAEDGIKYLEIDENSDDGKEYLEAIREEAIEKLGYFLKPSELFSQIAKRGNGEENNFILEDLTQILRNIEQTTMGHESEDDFVHLFEDLDLTSTKLGRTEAAKNALIAKVLSHLDAINFELKNHDRDVLGDAYEYLIGQFAAGAGKKAGEFYTPQQVSKILAKIVTTGKSKLKSVYDPTCGSGSLLLRVAKEVDDVSNFYGQELNRTTYNLARMNMIMHDVHYRKFDIKQEDTLEHPQHLDKRFEAVVANPPFSAHWSANPLHMSDDRFSQYGKLAPSSKADFAFVQHMIYHLDENGIMAVVLPHGVLFRGAAEGHIRRYLIEDRNYLDAVIGLPANIFYGTSIPTCILVFKKCREASDNVLFIDASNEFEKAKNQNILTDANVEKIVATYRNRDALEKYSQLATLEEIAENDYNLNIPRYVDTFEEEEPIDLEAVTGELKALEEDMKITDAQIAGFCKELGIPAPFQDGK